MDEACGLSPRRRKEAFTQREDDNMQRILVAIAAVAVVAFTVSIAEAGRFGRRGGCSSCSSGGYTNVGKEVQAPTQGPKASPSDAGTVPPPPPPPGGATPPPPPPGGGAAIEAAPANATATASAPTYSTGSGRRFRLFGRR
jgi:hypothetical protein